MLLHNDNRSGKIRTVCPRVAAAMKQTRDTAGFLRIPEDSRRNSSSHRRPACERADPEQPLKIWQVAKLGVHQLRQFLSRLSRTREDINTIAPKKDDSMDATKVRVSLQRQQVQSFIYSDFRSGSGRQVGSEQDCRPVRVPEAFQVSVCCRYNTRQHCKLYAVNKVKPMPD